MEPTASPAVTNGTASTRADGQSTTSPSPRVTRDNATGTHERQYSAGRGRFGDDSRSPSSSAPAGRGRFGDDSRSPSSSAPAGRGRFGDDSRSPSSSAPAGRGRFGDDSRSPSSSAPAGRGRFGDDSRSTGNSGRTQYQSRTRLPFKKKFCFFTRNHITYIDYKDTLLLKRFLGRSGQILSPRITGVKPIYQRKLAFAVKRARFMALIPYVGEVVREDFKAREFSDDQPSSRDRYSRDRGDRDTRGDRDRYPRDRDTRERYPRESSPREYNAAAPTPQPPSSPSPAAPAATENKREAAADSTT